MSEQIQYWEGPCGVRIPTAKGVVIMQDGVNYQYQDGTVTERDAEDDSYKMTVNEYREKYAVQRSDGNWYWKVEYPIRDFVKE